MNNQNIPAQKEFRDAFIAPEDYYLINADYGGQESIILANNSLDIDLLEFYDNGAGDLHAFIAEKIFGTKMEDILKSKNKKDTIAECKVKGIICDLIMTNNDKKNLEQRQIAKSAGFAMAYGGNGYTIASNLGISAKEGDRVYDDYFRAFPGLKQYFENVVNRSLRQGYILIDNITRRKFFFPYIKEMHACELKGNFKRANELKGKMSRAAMNYCIQGAAGSMTKYAIVLIYKWLLKDNLQDKIKLVLTVHDEIILEAAEGYQNLAAEKLSYYMEEAGSLWCTRVPIKADSVISKTWEH